MGEGPTEECKGVTVPRRLSEQQRVLLDGVLRARRPGHVVGDQLTEFELGDGATTVTPRGLELEAIIDVLGPTSEGG